MKARASAKDEAIKKAGEAFYIQSGLNKMVNNVQETYTPEIVKSYSGWILFVHTVVVDKQLNYKWQW